MQILLHLKWIVYNNVITFQLIYRISNFLFNKILQQRDWTPRLYKFRRFVTYSVVNIDPALDWGKNSLSNDAIKSQIVTFNFH